MIGILIDIYCTDKLQKVAAPLAIRTNAKVIGTKVKGGMGLGALRASVPSLGMTEVMMA
jgi:hypothetical protein